MKDVMDFRRLGIVSDEDGRDKTEAGTNLRKKGWRWSKHLDEEEDVERRVYNI